MLDTFCRALPPRLRLRQCPSCCGLAPKCRGCSVQTCPKNDQTLWCVHGDSCESRLFRDTARGGAGRASQPDLTHFGAVVSVADQAHCSQVLPGLVRGYARRDSAETLQRIQLTKIPSDTPWTVATFGMTDDKGQVCTSQQYVF